MELCNDDWISGVSILLIEIIRENGKIRLNAIRMVKDSIIRLVLFHIFNI